MQYDRFGLLTDGSHHQITEEPIAANAQVVQKTAEDAAVLLKNDNQALPLKSSDLASLAMIGPGAGQTMATGGIGERGSGRADRWIGTVDVLKQLAPTANVTYAVADDMTGTPFPPQRSHTFQARPLRYDGVELRDKDRSEDRLHGQGRNALPAGSGHTWNGTITVPETGSYWLNLGVLGTTGSVSIDGWPVVFRAATSSSWPSFGSALSSPGMPACCRPRTG